MELHRTKRRMCYNEIHLSAYRLNACPPNCITRITEFVSVSVTQNFCSVILKSLDLRHVNDDSNTN